jgi:hypothetical protein
MSGSWVNIPHSWEHFDNSPIFVDVDAVASREDFVWVTTTMSSR